MKQLDISSYVIGPECSEVIVVAANGTRARAEHPERHDPKSRHYMPMDQPLYLLLPRALNQRTVEWLAQRKALELCAGNVTVEYRDRHKPFRWLRRTHP